jgi:hypothetical protein
MEENKVKVVGVSHLLTTKMQRRVISFKPSKTKILIFLFLWGVYIIPPLVFHFDLIGAVDELLPATLPPLLAFFILFSFFSPYWIGFYTQVAICGGIESFCKQPSSAWVSSLILAIIFSWIYACLLVDVLKFIKIKILGRTAKEESKLVLIGRSFLLSISIPIVVLLIAIFVFYLSLVLIGVFSLHL